VVLPCICSAAQSSQMCVHVITVATWHVKPRYDTITMRSRPPWSSPSTFINITPTERSCIPSYILQLSAVARFRLLYPSSRTPCHLTFIRRLVYLLIPVSQIFSWHTIITVLFWWLRCPGLRNSTCYSIHVNNFLISDWHWHWHWHFTSLVRVAVVT